MQRLGSRTGLGDGDANGAEKRSDRGGNARIVGGTADVGGHECQSPALLDFYARMQSYGLATDPAVVCADADSDHKNNRQEWAAGTNPTNAAG